MYYRRQRYFGARSCASGFFMCTRRVSFQEPLFSHESLDNVGFTGSQAVPYQGMGEKVSALIQMFPNVLLHTITRMGKLVRLLLGGPLWPF